MKYRKESVSIFLFLLIPLCSFILDGMINKRYFIIGILALALGLCKGFHSVLLRVNYIWILFILAVLLSLMQRPISAIIIQEVTIYIFILLFAVFSDCNWHSLYKSCIAIKICGILNAFFVLMQYALGEKFNSLFWPLYTDSWQEYMDMYYKTNYYMGIQPVPGDTAGIIEYYIAIVFCSYLSTHFMKKHAMRLNKIIIVVILFIPLLLTGKKGVLFASIISIILLTLTLFLNGKQYVRIMLALGIIFIGYLAIRYYLSSNMDNPLFYRINMFINQVSSGDAYDSGRTALYDYALLQWRERPVWGIGWRRFRETTTLYFNYSRMHDVNLDYLQFLCETGIIGFCLILSVILTMFFRTIYILRHIFVENMDANKFVTLLSASFIQFFTVIYAFFEIPFYDRMLFFPIYIFSSICISKFYQESKERLRINIIAEGDI